MADLDKFEAVARLVLDQKIGDHNPTENDIKDAVNKASLVMKIDNNGKIYIEKLLQSSYKVRMDLGTAIKKAEYHPWVHSRKAQMPTYYWDRYYKYLEQNGWDSKIITALGDVSDAILDLCGNPMEKDSWKRKGLILGDIQSGKTSNYLALCNKAADAGYKVIIILTGMIESLRKQTQERVDAGFVGLNSRNVLQRNPKKKYIGVGNIDSNRTAFPFTDVISDFNSAKLQALNFTIKGMAEPVILVLKKNKRILENLATWLSTTNTSRTGEKIDLPMLLIDDEADNASVNTNKPNESPTAINDAIVKILKLFNRASYVAVTATPFANIFIDPELDQGDDDFNLFPSDFIYSLSAPTNYIGANKIFPEDGEYHDALMPIDDVVIDADEGEYYFKSKAKSNHVVPGLPNSLQNAINYFLLVNAVIDFQGNNKSHRSMLINVSQYVNVQDQVFEFVKDYLKKYQRKINAYSKLGREKAEQHSEIRSLINLWNRMDMSNKTGITIDELLDGLNEAVAPIQVRLINQKAKQKGIDRLDYEPYKEQGLRVIAIGGNSLSRGLTLEGLCVSYFDRNSQMYDTLMQMGRWFGYRKGYENLFKIWMEPTAMDWYEYISYATDELKDEIGEMNRDGLEPKDFGYKVQQNVISLFVTARNKMRATKTIEKTISLAAEVVETPRLIASMDNCLKVNLNLTNELLLELEKGDYFSPDYNWRKNRRIYKGVSKEIISKYIGAFVSHPRHIPFNAKDLSEYIKNSSDNPTWTVAVVGGKGDELENKYFDERICNKGLHYLKRIILLDDNCLLIHGTKARVGVPGETKCGLTRESISRIETMYKEKNKEKKTIPDKPYLCLRREPVLLIYLIKIDKEKKELRKNNSDIGAIKLVGDYPIVGIGLGFPGAYPGSSSDSEKVKYVLNRVAERNMLNFEENYDDDDE